MAEEWKRAHKEIAVPLFSVRHGMKNVALDPATLLGGFKGLPKGGRDRVIRAQDRLSEMLHL